MSFGSRVRTYTMWWRKRRAAYGTLWCAKAPVGIGPSDKTKPRADRVDHAMSAVFERGWRVYAFHTEAQRNDFLSNWSCAVACEDPVDE